MNRSEKRKFERIPNDDLPTTFKTLKVDVGEHKNLNAKTVDVSTTGIGVFLSVHPEVTDKIDKIVLHSSDKQHKFSGQIVHTKKLKEDQYRVGVKLKYSG